MFSLMNKDVEVARFELSLPFYTEDFTETQAKWLTNLVNYQIDAILQ